MPLEPRAKAPAFTLIDQGSNKVELSGFKGRNVLVHFHPGHVETGLHVGRR